MSRPTSPRPPSWAGQRKHRAASGPCQEPGWRHVAAPLQLQLPVVRSSAAGAGPCCRLLWLPRRGSAGLSCALGVSRCGTVENAGPESGSVLPRDLWCLPREGLAHFCGAVCRKRGLWLCRQKPQPERRACLSRKPLQGCSAWSSPPSVLWHLPRCPLGSGSEHGWSPSPRWAGEQGRGQASGASEDLLSGLEARSRERDDLGTPTPYQQPQHLPVTYTSLFRATREKPRLL